MKNIVKTGTKMLSSSIAGDLIGSLKPLTEQVPSPGGEILGGLADFASGFFPLSGGAISHVNRDGHS